MKGHQTTCLKSMPPFAQNKGFDRPSQEDCLISYRTRRFHHFDPGGLNQREIGEMLGLDYTSVSVGRKRWREAMEGDRAFAGLAGRVEAAIVNQG